MTGPFPTTTRGPAIGFDRTKDQKEAYEAYKKLRKHRAGKAEGSEKAAAWSEGLADLAGTVDVGHFLGQPVSTLGRDVLAGLSAGAGISSGLMGIEGKKITEWDPLKAASEYHDELTTSMSPLGLLRKAFPMVFKTPAGKLAGKLAEKSPLYRAAWGEEGDEESRGLIGGMLAGGTPTPIGFGGGSTTDESPFSGITQGLMGGFGGLV